MASGALDAMSRKQRAEERRGEERGGEGRGRRGEEIEDERRREHNGEKIEKRRDRRERENRVGSVGLNAAKRWRLMVTCRRLVDIVTLSFPPWEDNGAGLRFACLKGEHLAPPSLCLFACLRVSFPSSVSFCAAVLLFPSAYPSLSACCLYVSLLSICFSPRSFFCLFLVSVFFFLSSLCLSAS